MDDAEVATPTELAPSDAEDERGVTENAIQEPALASQAADAGDATAQPAMPHSAGLHGAEATPVATTAAPGPVLGPLGTAPYGAQAPTSTPTPEPLPRGDRERSPRRESDTLTAAVRPVVPDAARSAAEDALARGDCIADSLDSLPVVEEQPAASGATTASNARGGASLT
jgi:hypothetical protein